MKTAELTPDRDQTAVQDILERIKDSWNRGDAVAFGALFTADADYTVWNGLYDKGRQAITNTHAHIFNTFYKDSKLEGELLWARPLSDEVMLAQLQGQITLANGQPAGHPTKPLAVLHRQNGQWLIAAWQNTPVMPHPLADESEQEPA